MTSPIASLAVFDLLRRRRHGDDVILCAFDLLELDGQDMRRAPLEERKAVLAKLLHRTSGGIVYNEHYEADGAIIYKHACARLDSCCVRRVQVHTLHISFTESP
jgi:ATP-dependent DNA ligase